MIHMSGSSSDEFEEVGAFLAEHYSVYALDLLAFGSSDKPPRKYTMAEHANTVISFMDALNLKQVYLIGNLVGANMALDIAKMYPKRVIGMLLSSVVYNPDYEKFKSIGSLPVFQTIEVKDDGSHLTEMWNRTARYGESAAITDAKTRCLHIAGEWGESLHWALFKDDDLTASLPKISVPTLILSSPDENNVNMAKIICRAMPNAKCDVVENLNPFFARKYPEEFARFFLDGFGS
ncbi:alpha/beta hydrolase, partial [bacterium]|nr:alpha/beta hydrolase [bacterium]